MWKTIFKCLDKRAHPTNAEIEKIQPYIFLRWLQNNPRTIFAANQFNLYHKVPIVNQYNTIKDAFAGQNLYIAYPKNMKDESYVDEILAKHFKINMDKAKEYRTEWLDEFEIAEIVEMYNKIKG